VRLVRGALEERHVRVLARDVLHRREVPLPERERPGGVGHDPTVEEHPDPIGIGHDPDVVCSAHLKASVPWCSNDPLRPALVNLAQLSAMRASMSLRTSAAGNGAAGSKWSDDFVCSYSFSSPARVPRVDPLNGKYEQPLLVAANPATILPLSRNAGMP